MLIMLVNMTVQPKHVLKGDLISHAGAIVRVTEIVATRRNYKFYVTYENSEITYYYYRPTDTVKLLSI
jgi:hypothetical protein